MWRGWSKEGRFSSLAWMAPSALHVWPQFWCRIFLSMGDRLLTPETTPSSSVLACRHLDLPHIFRWCWLWFISGFSEAVWFLNFVVGGLGIRWDLDVVDWYSFRFNIDDVLERLFYFNLQEILTFWDFKVNFNFIRNFSTN